VHHLVVGFRAGVQHRYTVDRPQRLAVAMPFAAPFVQMSMSTKASCAGASPAIGVAARNQRLAAPLAIGLVPDGDDAGDVRGLGTRIGFGS